jgi:hypothetical protein
MAVRVMSFEWRGLSSTAIATSTQNGAYLGVVSASARDHFAARHSDRCLVAAAPLVVVERKLIARS